MICTALLYSRSLVSEQRKELGHSVIWVHLQTVKKKKKKNRRKERSTEMLFKKKNKKKTFGPCCQIFNISAKSNRILKMLHDILKCHHLNMLICLLAER